MNYLIKVLFLTSALLSLIISGLFFLSLAAWLSGGGSILIPGLGLIVAMGAIVMLLFLMAATSLSLTILLYKSFYKKDMA